MEIRKLYIDMDGVLADFDKGVRQMCHCEVASQDKRFPKVNDAMWEAIRGVPRFYEQLEVLPGAKEMLRDIYAIFGNRCEILSGIPRPHRMVEGAAEGKIRWMRQHFEEDIKINIVYREDKKDFVTGKDCVLIDDLDINIAAWEASGGTGILHLNPEETLISIQQLLNG